MRDLKVVAQQAVVTFVSFTAFGATLLAMWYLLPH